jgi:AhpD family alkylhydroperoxidase
VVYKKRYSVPELYAILVKGLRAMPRLVSARAAGLVSAHLSERIMLAVTEVNGCEVCSYAHTRMALESGMAPEEIRMLLAGNTGAIPVDESLAIVFAQHYADSRGNPTRESWQRLLDGYGAAKSLGILGAARMMMIGNALGIALSAFLKRLKGRSVAKSSLGYEAAMMLSVVPLFPAALVHAVAAGVLRTPIIEFPPV